MKLNRLHLIRNRLPHHRQDHRTIPSPRRLRREIRLAPDAKMDSVYVVMKRKPLSDVPWVYRWLARFIYFQIGWASDHSLELQGGYFEEAAARHAASGAGMSYMQVPLNDCLPEETCQNGTHDYPLSDASIDYRSRQLSMVAVPRSAMIRLQQQLQRTKPLVTECRKSA